METPYNETWMKEDGSVDFTFSFDYEGAANVMWMNLAIDLIYGVKITMLTMIVTNRWAMKTIRFSRIAGIGSLNRAAK